MLADPYIILKSDDLNIFDLSDIAKIFAQYINNSDIILLSGRVGAGKTEFARLVIKAKAINENLEIEEVSSPTFSLVQTYEFQHCKISHIDLYRVNSEVELFELGIPDNFFDCNNLEWPRFWKQKSVTYICIKIKEAKELEDHRDFTIEFFGGWDDLSRALLGCKYFNSERNRLRKYDLIFAIEILVKNHIGTKSPGWGTKVSKEFNDIDTFEFRCRLKLLTPSPLHRRKQH